MRLRVRACVLAFCMWQQARVLPRNATQRNLVVKEAHESVAEKVWVKQEKKNVYLSPFLTDLMTPTATVTRMSRTAKRPSGG